MNTIHYLKRKTNKQCKTTTGIRRSGRRGSNKRNRERERTGKGI